MPVTATSTSLIPTPPSAPQIDAQHAYFKLRVAASPIHRWGVYAKERIPADCRLIEYCGEKVSRRETKIRAEREFNYLFTLDSYWAVDGSVGGSGAEYINHCCEPNTESRIIRGHIYYYSIRAIKPGEELTIDYRFGHDVEKHDCACGAPACRGTINLHKEVKPKRAKKKA